MSTDEGATVSGFLDRLGRRAVRNHWWFIGVWIVAAVAIVALAGALDGQFSDTFRIPDTQSQEALDLLERDFPSAAGDNALVVFETPDGITSATAEPPISASIAALGKIPNVTSVTSPWKLMVDTPASFCAFTYLLRSTFSECFALVSVTPPL